MEDLFKRINLTKAAIAISLLLIMLCFYLVNEQKGEFKETSFVAHVDEFKLNSSGKLLYLNEYVRIVPEINPIFVLQCKEEIVLREVPYGSGYRYKLLIDDNLAPIR